MSSGLAVGGGNGPGTVTWQLGFMTADGALAALAETNASAAAFVQRMTNDGTALAPADLDGQTWRRSAVPAPRLTSTAGFTLVITGNATRAQLRELAASLRRVAR